MLKHHSWGAWPFKYEATSVGYPRGACVKSVLILSILSWIRVFAMVDFNLVMQTLITINNKESNKLQNLNVLRYYNALGMGVQVCEMGKKAIKPNYLLQTIESWIIIKCTKCKDEKKKKLFFRVFDRENGLILT